MQPAPIQLEHADSGPRLEQARTLFAEYARVIEPLAGCSLQYQKFDAELATLPGLYARPRGRMLIVLADGQPAGCIALRPLPALGPGACEMKRMYVRPAFRGRGIGRMLAARLLTEAAAAGYSIMKLDTSSTMHEAMGLYRSLGFVECPRYNDDPMDDTLWFERRLP
ncbi:MAG: GNAT family N-acetyltransferase [Phycisphaeraceae bacterium]|nr:GNAT family N-acetyltransferase [Phycisphaeraceae bacterium]